MKTQTQLSKTHSFVHRIKHFAYASLILMLTAFAASTSQAATFYAATTADLLAAIQQAEANSGDDVIYLLPYSVYKLTAADNGENGLPKITTKIQIVGNGATIERDASAPNFRFFEVASTGDLTLENLTLRGGKTAGWGGGAILNHGTLALLRAVLDRNSVDGTIGPWPGGAVYNSRGSIKIDGSTFRSNTAPNGGGLASDGDPGTFQPAIVSIVNSSFVYNSAVQSPFGSGMGGGIFLRGAHSADVTNTTIANNKGLYGGGVCFHTLARYDNNYQVLTAKFRNVTIAANRATSYGGGLNYQNCSGSIGNNCPAVIAADFGNSVIANNIAPKGRNYDSNYAYKSSGHNVIGLGNNGFGIDPDNGNSAPHPDDVFLTGYLADIGGLSSNGAAGGEHIRPLPNANSLIINKGNFGMCKATDQLGLNRFGPANTCEIGAIEYRTCTNPPSDMTAWWAFDESYFLEDYATWSVLNNANPNPNGPLQTAGMVGGSATFTNANQALTVPSHAEINLFNSCTVDGGAAFSIDAWVKTSSKGLQSILDKRQWLTKYTPKGYHLFVVNGQLGFQLADGTGHANFIAPPSVDLSDGQWHFVAVTIYVRCQRNGSAFEGKLFIDGNEVHQFQPGSLDYSNNAPLLIGGHSTSASYFFNGSLDEIEIFQRTLNPTEIMDLYQAGWAGKCGKKTPPPCWPECK